MRDIMQDLQQYTLAVQGRAPPMRDIIQDLHQYTPAVHIGSTWQQHTLAVHTGSTPAAWWTPAVQMHTYQSLPPPWHPPSKSGSK